MKYVLCVLMSGFLSINVFALENKKNRKPASPAAALQMSNTISGDSILLTDLKMKCQVVLLDNSAPADLSQFQLKDLVVDKAQYNDDDGGKSVTFWVKDKVVRNLTCLL